MQTVTSSVAKSPPPAAAAASRVARVDAALASLASLDALHRDALTVLALVAERPVSRTRWQERGASAGLVDDRGRKIYGEAWKAILDRLVDVGAAVIDARYEHAIDPLWLAPVLEDAHRRGRLGPLTSGLGVGGPLHRFYVSDELGTRGRLLAGLVMNDATLLERAQSSLRYDIAATRIDPTSLVGIIGLHAPSAWIARLEPGLRSTYLRDAVELAFIGAWSLGAGPREHVLLSDDEDLRAQLAVVLALAGDAAAATSILDGNGRAQWTRAARGFVALTEGKHAEARERFAEASVGSRGQRVELPSYLAIVDVLLAVTSDRAAEVADVVRRMHKGKRNVRRFAGAAMALEELEQYRRTANALPYRYLAGSWIDALVITLAESWMSKRHTVLAELAAFGARARDNDYAWLAGAIDDVASKKRDTGLLALFGTKEGWELVLESLRAIAEEPRPRDTSRSAPKVETELWWQVTVFPDARGIDVEAFDVKRGSLTAKGKAVSWRALRERRDTLESEDRRVMEEIAAAQARGYGRLPCMILSLLAGHPRVRDGVGRPVTVENGEPKLVVERSEGGATLRFSPLHFDDRGAAVEREDDRLVLYVLSPAARRILASLPHGRLFVPTSGVAKMSEALGALGGTITVDAGAGLLRDAVVADPRIHVQLHRNSAGMRARLRVLPGGAGGHALRPGAPPAEAVASIDGALVRVTRDLADETARLEHLLEACPTLASLPREGDDFVANDLATCLELLLELEACTHDPRHQIAIDWREGDPLRAPIVRGAPHLRLRVTGDRSWLSVEGEITVDDTRVLAMRELLEASSRAVGRFVPLGEGEWLALTDDVRRKVEMLGRATALEKGGRVTTALLPAMEGIWQGLDVSFTSTVAKARAALEEAERLEPRVPRTLAAELRDYQREGWAFLVRRTEASLGACLADDMGLGKTVQALALLLHRKKRGPAMVIAPTSVARNWEDEMQRFAPSLGIRRLRDGDRASCVAGAKAGDVVVATYGLLVAESELLASRTWGTIVLDEAHALKNASTRRWSAARGLRSEATVALTGTPVENHAGELHALFDLLVPGMLGTRALFDRVLAAPIASGDRASSTLLRQLVRPFVLRRTKAEVLAELPPKTELLRTVVATPEHAAFYEAVRRRAVEKMDAAKKAGGARAGRARIDLLAEITRLRRAAIDPRLVGGGEAPPGSKIDALVELAQELRAEGRRALVFSQFLEVLDLARTGLEAAGFECLRLDGKMAEGARSDEVAAFQAGRGDVFLVSLKAGGVGMNLTGADVVVLLDPWWNPAVEDQAAARAHRLGQTRPVTVVRIVTEATIEEKVLAVHAVKRKLYEDVVADADGSGTLDVEAIAALLGDSDERRVG